MDTVIKPENQADIWDNKATNISRWLIQNDALQQIKKQTGLSLEHLNLDSLAIAEDLDHDTSGLKFKNQNDGSIVTVIARITAPEEGFIEHAIGMASAYLSKTVICVSSEFSQSELNTISWLNANSAANVRFYAMKLEAWPTGTEVSAELSLASTPEDAMFNQLQTEFWTAFANYELKKRQDAETNDEIIHTIDSRMISSSNTITPRTFRTPCLSVVFFDPKTNTIGVGTRLRNSDKAERQHENLMYYKEEIEKAFPPDIKLQYTYKAPYDIWTKLEGADPYNRAKWDEYFEWILQTYDKFAEVIPGYSIQIR